MPSRTRQHLPTVARALAELGLSGRVSDIEHPTEARRVTAIVAGELMAAALMASRAAQLSFERGDMDAGNSALRAASMALRSSVSAMAEATELFRRAGEVAHVVNIEEARLAGVMDPMKDGEGRS